VREPFTQLFVHLVWSTWDRLPLLSPEIQQRVYACIRAECTHLKAEIIAIGGTDDHVHLLVQIPTTLAIASLMKQVKGVSSHLVTQEIDPPDGFKWQGAYGAFTVSKAEVPKIQAYVLNQEEHHRSQMLDGEFEPRFLPPGD
jgi:REP-associated tyrosine transposase